MTTFTVIGFYEDSDERFCDSVDAASAAKAEMHFASLAPDLVVVGVVLGSVRVADNYAHFIGSDEAARQVLCEPVNA